MEGANSPSTAPDGTLSKVDFARLVKRNPSQVTRWIDDGKISGAALVGSGRKTRVRADLAIQQLGLTLDLGQQLAQPSTPLFAQQPAPPSPAAPSIANDDQARRLRAQADQAEALAAASIRKEMAENGQWLSKAAAERELSAMIVEILARLDASQPMIVAEIMAAAPTADERLVTLALRAGLRKARARIAQEFDAAADEIEADGHAVPAETAGPAPRDPTEAHP